MRRSPRLNSAQHRPSPKPTPNTPKRTTTTPTVSSSTPTTTTSESTPIHSSHQTSNENISTPIGTSKSEEAAASGEEIAGAVGGATAAGAVLDLKGGVALELCVDGVTSFAVVPLTYCPHLLEINPSPDISLVDAFRPCADCHDHAENWICLTCLGCFCSRYVRGHAAAHFDVTRHAMTLSFSDMSIWCYACDSYVDNTKLDVFKQAALASKFSNKSK